MAFDYTKAAGQGVDQIDDSVLGMPLLSVIQTGSPQIKKSHKDYATKGIAGAEAGDIVFAPTNSLVDRPVKAIVLATTTLYTEWRPKSQGGGFRGNRPLTIVSDRNYRKGPAGTKDEHKEYLGENELKYTMFFAVQFLDNGVWKKGFIPFTSTGLRTAREWTKAIKRLRLPNHPNLELPIYAGQWNLDTKAEQNAEGDWMGWSITMDKILDPVADEALLTDAQASHTEVQKSLPSPKATQALPQGEVQAVNEDGEPY